MLQFSIYSAIDSPNQGLSIELLTNQKYAREGKKKWSMPDFGLIRGYLPLCVVNSALLALRRRGLYSLVAAKSSVCMYRHLLLSKSR
jgi:hypothetical protein